MKRHIQDGLRNSGGNQTFLKVKKRNIYRCTLNLKLKMEDIQLEKLYVVLPALIEKQMKIQNKLKIIRDFRCLHFGVPNFIHCNSTQTSEGDFLSIKNRPFLVSEVQHSKDTVGNVRQRTRCVNYLISIDVNGSQVPKEGMMSLFATALCFNGFSRDLKLAPKIQFTEFLNQNLQQPMNK